MALHLRSEPEWNNYLKATVGLREDQATAYSKIFNDNHFTEDSLSELTREYLNEIGITILGDVLTILKKSKPHAPQLVSDSPPVVKPPPPKLPLLTMETTMPQWRKFKFDWTSFKNITQLPDNQIASQLYNACDETVQMSLINTAPNVFELSEGDLLHQIESIVTQKSNPMIHRIAFRKLTQGPTESVQDYVVRLKSNAVDCEYTCDRCKHDLTTVHVRDQFISGLTNQVLQTDILTKANQLNDLNLVVQHAEAFESALRDQSKLSNQNEESLQRVSDYRKSKKPKGKQLNNNQQQQQQDQQEQHRDNNTHGNNNKKCKGCGSPSHGSYERESKCPAWGSTCPYCEKPNHFANVCKKKIAEAIGAIQIGRIMYDPVSDKFTSQNKEVMEIPAELTPFSSHNGFNSTPVKTDIFPDSGATVCIGGPHYMKILNVPEHNLIPTEKSVVAVGGSRLKCHG